MINIFPTVGLFSNLDLTTGNKKRNIIFFKSTPIAQKGALLTLANGIVLDLQRGVVHLGSQKAALKEFDVASLDKEKQDYYKTVKIITGEILYSDSWLDL